MGVANIVQRPAKAIIRMECPDITVQKANGTYRRVMDLRSYNGGSVLRYGDDIVILGRTEEEVQRIRRKLEDYLTQVPM